MRSPNAGFHRLVLGMSLILRPYSPKSSKGLIRPSRSRQSESFAVASLLLTDAGNPNKHRSWCEETRFDSPLVLIVCSIWKTNSFDLYNDTHPFSASWAINWWKHRAMTSLKIPSHMRLKLCPYPNKSLRKVFRPSSGRPPPIPWDAYQAWNKRRYPPSDIAQIYQSPRWIDSTVQLDIPLPAS